MAGNKKSDVWMIPLRGGETAEVVAEKALAVAEAAGLGKLGGKGRLVGILQHVGEGRNKGHVPPQVTGAIARRLKEHRSLVFLTGSATLYTGNRSVAPAHIEQAYAHGFTPDVAECPIIMSDGLRGTDRIEVEVPAAKHCKTAYLGSALEHMDALVVVSHPTGHIAAGFGASIKNVSMGLACRGGKLAMHHGGHPDFKRRACKACGRCAAACPAKAITIEKTAILDASLCIGCGQCYAVCPHGAISFEWRHKGGGFQERLVEYAAAVWSLLKGRMIFVNVCRCFTKECDCFDLEQEPLCPDAGIVASSDMVAADAAAADLINRAAGRDIVLEAGERDYRGMLEYAERLGIGSSEYALRVVNGCS